MHLCAVSTHGYTLHPLSVGGRASPAPECCPHCVLSPTAMQSWGGWVKTAQLHLETSSSLWEGLSIDPPHMVSPLCSSYFPQRTQWVQMRAEPTTIQLASPNISLGSGSLPHLSGALECCKFYITHTHPAQNVVIQQSK